MTAGVEILEGFAGPGGFDEAARMLGIGGRLGVDINGDACATATAAGHRRIQADIRTLDPDDYPTVTGGIKTPPCPTLSVSGKRSGLKDYQLVINGVRLLGDGHAGRDVTDAYADVCARITDMRTTLVLETLRFALRLPNLRWFVAEQVPAVHGIWEEMCSELAFYDWQSCHVLKLRMDDFGAPTTRVREIFVATRDHEPDFTGMPIRAHWSCGRYESPRWNIPAQVPPLATVSMAGALGWPAGVVIRTRGNRKTSGGNLFSADLPAQGLTEKARSWTCEGDPDQAPTPAAARALRDFLRDRPHHALTASEAGVLQGFPPDYPWQGSRSSQFLQIADTVSPLAGAAVLGAAAGVPWRDAVQTRLEQLYPAEALVPRTEPAQLDLLAGVVA